MKEERIAVFSEDKEFRKALVKHLKPKYHLVFFSDFKGISAVKSFYKCSIWDLRLVKRTQLKPVLDKVSQYKTGRAVFFIEPKSVPGIIPYLDNRASIYLCPPIDSVFWRALKKFIGMKIKDAAKSSEYILIDALTGCYNFQYFVKRLKEELSRAKRSMDNLSLVVLDIDRFRRINDRYGEAAGDSLLKEIALLLRRTKRANDILIRAGEEKFILMLVGISKKNAYLVASRLYKKMSSTKFLGGRIKIKTSIGVASYPEDGIKTDKQLLFAAEKALTNAKIEGGNRVFVFSRGLKDEPSTVKTVSLLKRKLKDLDRIINQSFLDMVYGLAKTIEAKDRYTGRHVENTSEIAWRIARKLGLPAQEIENIKHAAILHDLGKIGIPEKILLKRGPLNEQEMAVIKKHPLIGAHILSSIHSLKGAVPYIKHHHEHFDGSGYPSGLKGKKIPLGARIIAIADAFQALVSDRPYRKAFSQKKALEIIKQEAGTHFDPNIVKAFFEIVNKDKHP